MRAATLIGILLIVLGVVALTRGGFSYKEREKVVDIGPIEATATTRKTVPLSPVLGVLSLVGGIVLVVVGTRRTA
jgi:drug/metabolite transporter (DMT)-like permease